MAKIEYRIKNIDGTYLNAGSGLNSWFTLDVARTIVNYSIGQQIRWQSGVYDYGEAL